MPSLLVPKPLKKQKISLIFTTKNNELAILGKTLDDVKNKFIQFDEITMQGASFGSSKTKLIPEIEMFQELTSVQGREIVNALNGIKDGTNSAFSSMDEYLTWLGGKGKGYVANYVKENQNQIYTTDGVIAASKAARDVQIAQNLTIQQSTIAYKAATVAKRAFAMAGNILVMMAVTKGIELAAKAIDNYIHRLDNAKDALSETQSEIESTKSEIEETAKQIKELEALDPSSLSITDKEDLQRLKDQNEELRIRQQYLAKQEKSDLQKVADLTKKKYNQSYSGGVDRDNIDSYKDLYNKKPVTNTLPSYLTGESSTQTTQYAALAQNDGLSNTSTDLANLIAQYEHFSEEKKKAIENEDAEAIKKYNVKLEETALKLREDRTELQGFSDDLSATGESSPELDEITSKLKLIDDLLLSPGRNLTNFINSDSLTDNKNKLVELANSGKLTQEELSKNFTEVDKYLKENGLTLEDLISVVKIYKDELAPVYSDETPTFSDILSSLPMDKLEEYVSLINSGAINEKTISSYSDLASMMDETGVSAESAMKSMKDFAEWFTLPTEMISNLQAAHDLIKSLGETDGKFDTSSLESIVKLYPQMESAVSDYIVGLRTEGQVIDELTSHYEMDMQNYGNYMIAKNATNIDFANAVGLNSAEVVNQFATDYGVDIGNHTTYAQKKILIEQQTLQTISDMWSKYYNAQSMSLTKAGQALEDDILSGNGANDPEAMALYNRLHKQTKTYQEAMNALNNISYEGIGTSFNPIAAGGGGGSKGGSKGGAGSGSSKVAKEQLKEYDWIERALDAIQRKRSALKEQSDAETESYRDQKDALYELIDADNEFIELNKNALSTYTQRWEAVKNELLNVFGDAGGNALIAKIMNGDTSKDGSLNNYTKEQSDIIDKAIDNYDQMIEAEDDYDTSIGERTQHQKELFEKRIAEIESYVDRVSSAMDSAESRMDIKTTTGREITEQDYKELINLSDDEIDLYYEQLDVLNEQIDSVSKGTPKYYNLKSAIASCQQAISSAEESQAEWNEEIKNIPIRKMERYLSILKNIKSDLSNYMSEQSALGINSTEAQYQQMIDISEQQISKLLEQQKIYNDNLADYDWNSEKYNETATAIQDIDDEISDLIQSQIEWNQSILQIPIDNLTKTNDTLSSVASAMGDVLSDYDTAISAVTGAIDNEIDSINDLKDATEETYQDKIDPLQNELDLLEKQNKERQTQLALEQASYNLKRAETQKNVTAIRDGEEVHISDIDDLRAANKEQEEAEYNKVVSDLQNQIEELEKERDAILAGYDEQIDKLDEIKDRWSSIKQDIEDAAGALKADSILGEGWKDKVLSGDDRDMLNSIKDLYSTISSQKTQYEEQIASNERIANMMNQFMEQWMNGSITYEQAISGINNLATQMADGFTSLEHLDSIFGLNDFDNLSDMLNGLKESSNASVQQFESYMQIVKANADAIANYTASWAETQRNIKDQIAALETLAAESAKAAESIKEYISNGGGGGSKNDISNGTIYADGTTTITNENVEGFYTGNTNPGGNGDNSGYVDAGPGIEKHHDGLKGKPVGSSFTNQDALLKILGSRKLEPGETFSLLNNGEKLINPEQQKILLDNFSTAWNFTPKIPDYSSILTKRNEIPNITCQIGDINLTGVQDPDGFAKAFAREIEPCMQQSMSKIFK